MMHVRWAGNEQKAVWTTHNLKDYTRIVLHLHWLENLNGAKIEVGEVRNRRRKVTSDNEERRKLQRQMTRKNFSLTNYCGT